MPGSPHSSFARVAPFSVTKATATDTGSPLGTVPRQTRQPRTSASVWLGVPSDTFATLSVAAQKPTLGAGIWRCGATSKTGYSLLGREIGPDELAIEGPVRAFGMMLRFLVLGNLALKLSTQPFSQGVPGSMKTVFAPTTSIQFRASLATN